MLNLQKCYDKLSGFTNKTLTTKEIKELGITEYYIKILVKKGKIKRIKRGSYIVQKKSSNFQARYYIHEFSKNIIDGRYGQAYHSLITAYNNRESTSNDNVIRVGFILLEKIFGKKNPIPNLDTLQELTLEEKPEAIAWNAFCRSVVNRDFVSAVKNIEDAHEAQIKNQGLVGDTTKAMGILANKVLSITQEKIEFNEIINQINELISKGYYEEAIKNEEEVLEKITDRKLKDNYTLLIDLIKTVIAFQKDEKLVLNNEQMPEYSGCDNYYMLFSYLKDQNYLKALEFARKIGQESSNHYYKSIEKLLIKLDILNKRHISYSTKIIESAARYHFKRFLQIFSVDNLEESIQELTLSLNHTDPNDEKYLFNSNLLHMLEKLQKMINNGEVLEEKNINYNLKKDYIYNFDLAIQEGDYKKALAFNHLINLNNSITFTIKLTLLKEMSKWDKINREKQKEEKSAKKEEIILEKDSTKTEETKKESPEEKTIELTYDNIYDLIYKREYDQALALVTSDKDHGTLSRLCSIVARLIKQIKFLEKGQLSTVYSKEKTNDKFKDFYQSLKDYDYEYAYELSSELISSANDPSEFVVYKLLLEDLKDLYIKNKNTISEIDDIDYKINQICIAPKLTREDIDELIDLLDMKIELKKQISRPIDNELCLIEIADMTILSLEGKLSDDDFGKVKCDSSLKKARFANALRYGDYKTSYDIIKSTDWKCFDGIYDTDFLKLTEKLLETIISNLQVVKTSAVSIDNISKEIITEEIEQKVLELSYQLMTPEERVEKELGAFLHEIRKLVKERKYEEVYQKFLESSLPYEKLESIYTIIGNLCFVMSTNRNKANELYSQYLDSMEKNDIVASEENLKAYKNYIVGNYMDRNTAYEQKKIDILREDLKRDNFDEKEQIYLEALESYNEQNYEKSLALIEEYERLDQGLNYRGYLLKGKIEYKSDQIEEAKKSFAKVLSIIEEPEALRIMGNISFHSASYEEALNYFLRFESIKPKESSDVNQLISLCYAILGDHPKSQIYGNVAKQLSFLNK